MKAVRTVGLILAVVTMLASQACSSNAQRAPSNASGRSSTPRTVSGSEDYRYELLLAVTQFQDRMIAANQVVAAPGSPDWFKAIAANSGDGLEGLEELINVISSLDPPTGAEVEHFAYLALLKDALVHFTRAHDAALAEQLGPLAEATSWFANEYKPAEKDTLSNLEKKLRDLEK